MLHTALDVAGLVAIIVLVIACIGKNMQIARQVSKLRQALDSLSKLNEQRADAETTADKALENSLHDLAEKVNEADNHWRMAEERLKRKTTELELMAKSLADQVDRATHLPKKILAAVELVGRVFRKSFEAEENGTGQESLTKEATLVDSSEQSDPPASPSPTRTD
jgi:septal ring factor EnvC (AmiA/AmiB activator)